LPDTPSPQIRPRQLRPLFSLLVLTSATVLVQGYHLGTDDAEIYLPAAKRFFDPQLYPFGAEFFLTHARLSLFAPLVGYTTRLFHMPIDIGIFLWHFGCMFLFMLAGWELASVLFASTRARFTAVALLAGSIAAPIGGTALVIMDPYLTARSLSTPLTMFAVAAFLGGRKWSTVFWLLLTAFIHPQMVVYIVGFILFCSLPVPWLRGGETSEDAPLAVFALAPAHILQGFSFHPATGDYRQVLYMRTFFFAQLWQWYEWLALFIPMGILITLSRLRPAGTLPGFQRAVRGLIPFALFSTAAFLILSSTPTLETFVRLQPMRSLHLLHILLFLMLGGLIGDHLLKRRLWLWIAFFLPLTIGLYAVDRSIYPNSRHIEWPGGRETNPWVQAFYWVRGNTPKDAIFALNPRYIVLHADDQHGFRAVAERSAMADYFKDSGAVSMFPQLTADWKAQQDAQAGWDHFQLADFQGLRTDYKVTWVIVNTPATAGLDCAYRNSSLEVCRVPAP
jgi:hypothetical protein